MKKRRVVLALVALLAAGALGFLVSASGVIPIKASGGHWALTQWVLEFSMHRSVATHSVGVTVPPLDDPAMVLKGAGHYEFGCRACHGSPSVPTSRLASSMLPAPPYLPRTVREWDADELFTIVKHGIKFTGMPAWPSQRRDDEVWAMVAFLRVLPRMSGAEYQRLIAGEAPLDDGAPSGPLGAQRPPAVTENCAHCHGVEGAGRGEGAFPTLAGQSEAYLTASLDAFARGRRHSGIMQPIASELTATQRRELARYYAGQRPVRVAPAGGSDLAASISRGGELARVGHTAERIPSCAACHGPGATERNPMYPTLAGQYAPYLALQVELFLRGDRGGTAYAHLMHRAARGMTRAQIVDVARYYASLPVPGP